MIDRVVRFQSIRQRLLVSFSLLVALFCAAGLAGRAAIMRMSDVIGETLETVQQDAQLSSRLSGAVTQELAAAQRYLETRDTLARGDFLRLSRESHAAQRAMNLLHGQGAREMSLVASIDARLSDIEVRYARAHRLADLGRRAAAFVPLRGAAVAAPATGDWRTGCPRRRPACSPAGSHRRAGCAP